MKRLAFAAILIATPAWAQSDGKPAAAADAPKAVKRSDIKLVNPDFEDAMQGTEIPGWPAMQHGGVPAYETVVDKRRPSSGKQAARITRLTPEYYGLIHQRVPAPPAGTIVEFSAALRTDEVGPLGWRIFIHFEDGGYVISDVASEPMTGTQTKWQRVTIRGPVPPHVRVVSVGAELLDGGTGWIDDVRLVAIDNGNVRPVEDKPHPFGLPRIKPKDKPADKPVDQKKP